MRHIAKNLFLVFAFLLIPVFSRAETDCAVTINPEQEYEKCPDCVYAEVVVDNIGDDAGWFHIWIWAADGVSVPCVDEEFCQYLAKFGDPGYSVSFNFNGREWCGNSPKCAPTGDLDIYVEVRYCGLYGYGCTNCEEEILCIGACSDL